MISNASSLVAPKQNLRWLLLIRWLLLLTLVLGMGVGYFQLQLELPYFVFFIIVFLIFLFNIATWLRLKKVWAVKPLEFFLQILLDIIGVTFLFYFSGGASNPFVSYYLVPLSIASATLPWRYTGWLTALSAACYTLLLFYHVPIPDIGPFASMDMSHASEHEMPMGSPINAHILGMWFNFIVSASLITFFVVRMSHALKQQQQELNDYREENLRDEQVLAVATLAAGTAHELGSPLTTIKLLLNEMAHDYKDNAALEKDLDMLQEQVDLCSHTLKDLVKQAEADQALNESEEKITNYCKRIIERWQVLRPDVVANVEIQKTDAERCLRFHSTVEQAIINLLNNAADASVNKVGVQMFWTADTLSIVIIDDGPGVAPDIKQQLGQAFVTNKRKGMGLGVFLSNATISRYGGSIKLLDEVPNGTRLEISLPIDQKH